MNRLMLALLIFVGTMMGQNAPSESAETNQPRMLRPRPNSPTAMKNCGADIEKIKADLSLVRYEFTGQEVLSNMQYCVAGKTVRVDVRHRYMVPAGTIGWISEDYKSVVLDGCANKAACVGCKPPAPPTPPAPPEEFVVKIQKETFDSEGRAMEFPTGAFRIFIGDQEVSLDADGKGSVNLPNGHYTVREEFDSKFWEQKYMVPQEFELQGQGVNVVIKNQQKRPEPQPLLRKDRRPPPEPKSKVNVPAEAAYCDAIFTDERYIWPGVHGGEAASGQWSIGDKVFSQELKAPFDQKLLYRTVGRRPGVYFITFDGQTAKGELLHCKMTDEVELKKQGRHWFWKLPGFNCAYAYTAGIKDWSRWGALEKLAFCPAEAGLAYYFWPAKGITGLFKSPAPVFAKPI